MNDKNHQDSLNTNTFMDGILQICVKTEVFNIGMATCLERKHWIQNCWILQKFPRIALLTLDLYLIMLSIKQGDIKYYSLSLWYDLNWDWNPASQAIGKHSNHYINRPVAYIHTYIHTYTYTHIYIYIYINVYIYIMYTYT